MNKIQKLEIKFKQYNRMIYIAFKNGNHKKVRKGNQMNYNIRRKLHWKLLTEDQRFKNRQSLENFN